VVIAPPAQVRACLQTTAPVPPPFVGQRSAPLPHGAGRWRRGAPPRRLARGHQAGWPRWQPGDPRA